MSDKREALTGLAIVAAGTAALALISKLVPKPEPKPWGSAFWLDPELWDRVPYNEKTGRYAHCWDHLDSKVLTEPPLAFEKPPPPPQIGSVKYDGIKNHTLLFTPDGWVPIAHAGVFEGVAGELTFYQWQIQQLWRKIQKHGWVKSGDWDGGYRCEQCWTGHTPGYHSYLPEPPRGVAWIKKPVFAPWLNWKWNESIRDNDPAMCAVC